MGYSSAASFALMLCGSASHLTQTRYSVHILTGLLRDKPKTRPAMTQPVEVWRYQGGASLALDVAYGVAAAADNSVFLLGTQYSSTSGLDFAAIKIGADGGFLWDWQDGSEGDDNLFSAAAVADGVVGSGYFNGTWNGTASTGDADFAAVKLFSNSTVAWRWQEGTEEEDALFAAIETTDGNVVVAGYTLGSWNDTNYFGWPRGTAAKLSNDDGEVIWRYQDEDGLTIVRAAAVLWDDSIVLGGYAYKSVETTFGEDEWVTDFLAVALDEDGNELWRWQDGPDTGYSYVYGVAAFDDGSVLLAGKTEGSWVIDNLGYGDFALAKLNASGHLEWSWQNGTEFDDEFSGAAIGTDGSVVLSGYTYGSWAATQAGDDDDRDFIAMSIDAEGDILWKYQAGTTLDDDFNDLAIRPDGLIVLGGWTHGDWNSSYSYDTYADFAAVLLNTTTSATSSTPFWTPTPTSSATSTSILLMTPSPTPFPTPSPTRSPTPYPIPSPTPSPTPSLIPSPLPSPTPSPTTPPTSPASTGSDSGTQTGLIIGTSIGGVAVIAILITSCLCWWSQRQSSQTTLPTALAPVATGKGPSIARTSGSENVLPPAYSNPPPTYSDPPPAYSSVA